MISCSIDVSNVRDVEVEEDAKMIDIRLAAAATAGINKPLV